MRAIQHAAPPMLQPVGGCWFVESWVSLRLVAQPLGVGQRWAHGDVIGTGTGTDSVPHPFQYPFPFPFHPFRNPFPPVPITVPGHFWALRGTERELTRSSYRYYRSCDRSRPIPITVPSRSRGRSCPFLYRSTRSRVGVGTDLGYFGPFLPRHTTSVHLGRPNRAL